MLKSFRKKVGQVSLIRNAPLVKESKHSSKVVDRPTMDEGVSILSSKIKGGKVDSNGEI